MLISVTWKNRANEVDVFEFGDTFIKEDVRTICISRNQVNNFREFVCISLPVNSWQLIRSPLNVVHAGLDILLEDLRSFQQVEIAAAMKAVIELAEDIYSASESAIHILNDLLEYEHLDAGVLIFE